MYTVYMTGINMQCWRKGETVDMLMSILPPHVKVKVEREGTSAKCVIYNQIWVNKEVQIGPSYSAGSFTDEDILKELAPRILSKLDIDCREVWAM